MRNLFLVTLTLSCMTCLETRAESSKQGGKPNVVSPDAAKIIRKNPVLLDGNKPQGQQGSLGNQVPQNGPGKLPQGGPTGVDTDPAGKPGKAVEDAVRAAEGAEAAREASMVRDQLDMLRPGTEGLDLDNLGADDARERGANLDPNQFGVRRPTDPAMDASVEALRNITGQLGSNRDKQSDTTRGMGSTLVTDPQALLTGAGSDLASSDGHVTKERNADGTVTEKTTHHYGDGSARSVDLVTRDSNGTIVSAQQTDYSPNGTVSHRADRTPEGDYVHSVTTTYPDGSGNTGPTPWRTPDWFADVDPDAPNQGGGSVVGPGQKKKDPKMVAARDQGVGPDARPDEQSAGQVAARVQLDEFDDVVNPPPEGDATGGGPTHRGFDPKSTYDGPRDPDQR